MKDFLHRNKVIIGALMGGVSIYLRFSCPGLDHTICDALETGSGYLSSFLIGAGALDSDYRQKFVQGVIIKTD